MSDLSQESPLWREWAESRHSVQQMREELDRLRAENARLIGDHAAALRLVTDVRAAIGDDGERMQPELIEYCKAMKRDAERYRWLRECGDAFDQLSVFDSRGNLVDEFLDRAIDAAMNAHKIAAAPELVEALRTARDYVFSELETERQQMKGYERISRIDEIASDLAEIDAALAKAGVL